MPTFREAGQSVGPSERREPWHEVLEGSHNVSRMSQSHPVLCGSLHTILGAVGDIWASAESRNGKLDRCQRRSLGRAAASNAEASGLGVKSVGSACRLVGRS